MLIRIAKDALRTPLALEPAYLDSLFDEVVAPDEPERDRLRQILTSRLLRSLGPTADPEDFVDARWLSIDPELCSCDLDEPGECSDACAVDAIVVDEKGHRRIDQTRCVECGLCVKACQSGAISAKSQCLELVRLFREGVPVYAELAPAFVGQFGEEVSVNQVKVALLKLGFADVWEVAMAADIITLQEADEYIDRMDAGEGFMITSCCCPAFVKLVEKHKPKIAHLVSHSVSPMIAMGRLLKARNPEAKVVFIGPCLAKRAEAKLPDLRDAVDLVITFKELVELLEAAEIRWEDCKVEEAGELTDASHDGRIYAHTGGVSEAIIRAIRERRPDLAINTIKGNGLKECMAILQAVEKGEIEANFMEGMGCPGGCVGGPGTIAPVKEAADRVARHADASRFPTASANERATEILGRYIKQIQLSSWKGAVASYR